MKKFALPALASVTLLGLSACGEPAEPVGQDESTMADPAMSDPAMTDPAMTEPVVPAPGQTDEGDSMMIDRSGMDATVTDGNTTTTVDIDENPSMSVESD